MDVAEQLEVDERAEPARKLLNPLHDLPADAEGPIYSQY